jgi:hypothetical protein
MAEDAPRVAVVATHSTTAPTVDTESLEEMTFSVSAAALERAGLTASTVDSVVIFGQDQMNGRVISCMVASGPVGGVDRDVTMIASSGEHALVYGYLRVLAQQSDSVLVVAWGKPSESVHPEHAELVHAEPYLLRRLGMNNTVAAALQASRLGHRPAGGTATVAWPLAAEDLPPQYDAVHAVVLRREGTFDAGNEITWVRGAGWAMDVYDMGARDAARSSALDAVVRQLAAQGAPPPSAWDRLEVAAPSEPAVEALTGQLRLSESCSVNPDGPTGSLATSPLTAGFLRMVSAAEAAGAAPGTVSAGVGMQGFAGQGAAAMVFGEA